MNHASDDAGIARLIDGITRGSADVGHLGNEVLAEFQRGLPVEKLLSLMHHSDVRVSEVGTWIAAELGSTAAPLLDDAVGFLSSPSRDMRFDAIDVVQTTAVGDRANRAAQILPLLSDDDSAVRWKATGFLARASVQQLGSALTERTAANPDDAHVSLLRWLLSARGRDSSAIRDRLAADDALTRRYAVAAAARLSEVTTEPLDTATAATDGEVRRFALDWLGMVRGTVKNNHHEKPGS